MSFDAEKKQESLVAGLAQLLRQDATGQVLADYESTFENLMTKAQSRLRTPLTSDECLLNKTIVEIAECAQRVIRCYWEKCHQH